jgi:hypothetical protein
VRLDLRKVSLRLALGVAPRLEKFFLVGDAGKINEKNCGVKEVFVSLFSKSERGQGCVTLGNGVSFVSFSLRLLHAKKSGLKI